MILKKKTTINCGGKLLDLSTPAVMGIMNVTPDSFYAESRISGDKEIVDRAEEIVRQGGAIIDIGAYSSRPNAPDVDEEEEYLRLRPAMMLVRKHFPNMFISVDTFRPNIVECLYDEFGCFIINDISAGDIDSRMIEYAGKFGLPYIAMHTRGTPQTMQSRENCTYNNIVADIISYFVSKKKQLLDAGISDIIVDPGFGFAKTLEGNYELLAGLDAFKILEQPVLVGMSRKSMFCKLLKVSPDKSLAATIAGNTMALQNGADILRVHDVKAASDTVKVFNTVKKYSE
ncbi:MAG: dihydropteroate synthase [Prevotellaceae bacterium]|jgi:dihydropteroate synthase|nr:dihydropteroate synthase [Prevotellaceae bacterium]